MLIKHVKCLKLLGRIQNLYFNLHNNINTEVVRTLVRKKSTHLPNSATNDRKVKLVVIKDSKLSLLLDDVYKFFSRAGTSKRQNK